MLFLLSNRISLIRKLLYIGLMIIVVSILMFSMIDISKPIHYVILPWIFVLLIAGLSILLLVPINKYTKNWYKKNKILTIIFMSIFVPVYISVLLYLLSIFFGLTDYGKQFIIYNLSRILVIIPPVLIFVQFMMVKKPIANSKKREL